ncbi:ArsR family transcriptional regulator [Halobacteria archaeon AArc-curdl1]|uniref:ArsR family transcriptional regulator n=1 Tax=Natronosalvus hydrolyticus TaxID=2979988 RepID=A0AAP2ZBG3_9EURY|nr:ArsR family transcriptional regulator [Halobacteria archaeon AArc-curdl1]
MSLQQRRSDTLAESEIFHILGNDRRRAIVQLLASEPGQVDVSAVATAIASQEVRGDDVSSDDTETVPNNLYKSVYVSLQQTHLPQLEEDDVIKYDSSAKTLRRGEQFDAVYRYVDGEHPNDKRLLLSHLSLSVLGLVVIVLAGFSLPVSIDPVLSSILVFLLVGASSLYRLLS